MGKRENHSALSLFYVTNSSFYHLYVKRNKTDLFSCVFVEFLQINN